MYSGLDMEHKGRPRDMCATMKIFLWRAPKSPSKRVFIGGEYRGGRLQILTTAGSCDYHYGSNALLDLEPLRNRQYGLCSVMK